MTKDKFGQFVYNEDDVIDILMQNPDISSYNDFLINDSNVKTVNKFANKELVKPYQELDITIDEFDRNNQENWYMPDQYKEMDIAEHILKLCKEDYELQRVGEELLLYQERDLFDLLKYLVYLVDTMKENNIIWGVGRGSSVSSYVLYLLGIHRVDSIFYDLDVREFLR